MNAIKSLQARFAVSAPDAPPTSELWQEAAAADYRLCREFARLYDARLTRSLRGQRVGWELFGHPRYALLLPDSWPATAADDWYFYYPMGESLFRRTRQERERQQMLILAESGDDWAGSAAAGNGRTDCRCAVRDHAA